MDPSIIKWYHCIIFTIHVISVSLWHMLSLYPHGTCYLCILIVLLAIYRVVFRLPITCIVLVLSHFFLSFFFLSFLFFFFFFFLYLKQLQVCNKTLSNILLFCPLCSCVQISTIHHRSFNRMFA